MKKTIVIGYVSHIYEGTPEEIFRLMDMEENRPYNTVCDFKVDANINEQDLKKHIDKILDQHFAKLKEKFGLYGSPILT